VLDDDEAVFGVLEGGDEEAADETEDEDVALHGGIVKKYNGGGEEASVIYVRFTARTPLQHSRGHPMVVRGLGSFAVDGHVGNSTFQPEAGAGKLLQYLSSIRSKFGPPKSARSRIPCN
jgi:hypothetical protein